jgi:hypothetical protein
MKLDRKKIIIILSALLLFQVTLLVLSNVFSSQNIKAKSMQKLLISGLKKENVTSFEIKDAASGFSIEKKDGKWAVKIGEQFIPGNESKINDYIETITKLNSGIIVYKGVDASSDRAYGFDGKKNQTLVVKTNNKKDFTLLIGNTGSKSETSYVRLENEKVVREVNSSIASQTSNLPSLWAIKDIVMQVVKQEEIKSIEISSAFSWFKGSYKITKEEKEKGKETFAIEPQVKGNLEENVLRNIAINAATLMITEYKLSGNIDEKNKAGSFKIINKAGKDFVFDFYKGDENDKGYYIVKTSYNSYIYLVAEEVLKQIFKDTKDMIVKEQK